MAELLRWTATRCGQLPQVREHLASFGDHLPDAVRGQLEALEQRLDG